MSLPAPFAVCPKVAVVTVTYGDRGSYLAEVLEALRSIDNADCISSVVVVDNGASAETRRVLDAKADGKLIIVERPENTGSADGYAAGIARAVAESVDFLWLLDDDNRPEAVALTRLLESAERHDRGVALQSLRPAYERLVRFASSGGGVPVYEPPDTFSSYWRRLLGRFGVATRRRTSQELPFATFGGFFAPREAFVAAGLPRADFVMYADDTEYTHRFPKNGTPIHLVPESVVTDIDRAWWRASDDSPALSPIAHLAVQGNESLTRMYYTIRNSVHFESTERVSNMLRYRFFLGAKNVGLAVMAVAAAVRYRTSQPWRAYRTHRQATADGLAGGWVAGVPWGGPVSRVAIVHDYLTQRGGAERVVLAMAEAFPDSPIYTSLYEPSGTYPEFADLDVRPSKLNRSRFLRRHHRAALPFLARTFESLTIDEGVVLASSSGWAHGVTAPQARKVVYCYTPARWLYLPEQYATSPARKAATAVLGRRLRRWDQRAAATADHYLANSTEIRDRIEATYGIEADVLHSPHGMQADAEQAPVAGILPGYFLVVSRLIGYKNVAAVVQAMRLLPGQRLVVVGAGPLRRDLENAAPPNVTFTGTVSDAELRWLYASSVATVSASHEDFGLVPLEGAAFGKPAVTLEGGGFLDTVIPGETGFFFSVPEAVPIAAAMTKALEHRWDEALLVAHADHFSKSEFIWRLQAAIAALSSRT